MAEKERPHRRFTVAINISGDTLDDVKLAIREIARDRVQDHVMGGSTLGYFVQVSEDPAMTHDKYFEALEKYLEPKPAEEVVVQLDPLQQVVKAARELVEEETGTDGCLACGNDLDDCACANLRPLRDALHRVSEEPPR